MAEKLILAAFSPEATPGRGRQISDGRRELTTVSPYPIGYRLVGDGVQVLEIRHGARRPD